MMEFKCVSVRNHYESSFQHQVSMHGCAIDVVGMGDSNEV
jgi:serine kinase of HPr protein (carbohydrate metabolism regulator)